MNKLKEKMVREAAKRYKSIYPCGTKRDFSQCFTTDRDSLFFWFNTEDNSTRMVCVKEGKIRLS